MLKSNPEDRPLVLALLAVALALILPFVMPSLFSAPNNPCAQHAEHAEAYKECAEALSAERVAVYTQGLAYLTAGLVIVGFLQVWLLLRTDRTAADNSIIAKRQADAAEKQTTLIGLQADILEKQKEIARQQALAVIRPKIRVRAISGPTVQDDGSAIFRVPLVNIGASDANVVSTSMEVLIHDGSEGIEVELREPDTSQDIYIPAGARNVLEIRTKGQWIQPHPRHPIIIWGEIAYQDGGKVERRTGIARERTARGGGGFHVADSFRDDEYED